MKTLLLRLLPGAILLAVWQLASGPLVRPIYVSKPTDVAVRLVEMFATGEIQPHLWTTLQELILGYTFGVSAGIAAGYALGRSPRAANILEPYLMAFYGIPKIALAPLFIIWFGIAIWSKVALAGTMVFFLVFYSVYAGVRAVDGEMVNLARVMGATPAQLTRHVYLPAASPAVLLGMRMAIPYSVIGVIAGEFTSSTKGLGLFINQASSTYDPAGVFAGITLLLVFVLAAGALATRVERRLLRWRPPLAGAPGDGS
jgi:NitT/TauT family transport system permease protein